MKADDEFEAVVESCRPQVQVTTPEITEWVVDMVGQAWLWVENSIMGGSIQRLEVGDWVFSG